MNIPGENILIDALGVIASQTLQYIQVSRTKNSAGIWVPVPATPVTITGSFQPIPRNLYEQYGLEYARDYYDLFVSKNVIDVGPDVSGDTVVFQNKNYQCLTASAWFAFDGWTAVRCVLAPPNVGI